MTSPDSSFKDQHDDRVPPLGGADAVEKTTYIADARGAEPNDPRDGETPVSAVVAPGHGPGILAWVMAFLAIVVVLAYVAGVF